MGKNTHGPISRRGFLGAAAGVAAAGIAGSAAFAANAPEDAASVQWDMETDVLVAGFGAAGAGARAGRALRALVARRVDVCPHALDARREGGYLYTPHRRQPGSR